MDGECSDDWRALCLLVRAPGLMQPSTLFGWRLDGPAYVAFTLLLAVFYENGRRRAFPNRKQKHTTLHVRTINTPVRQNKQQNYQNSNNNNQPPSNGSLHNVSTAPVLFSLSGCAYLSVYVLIRRNTHTH